MFNKKVKVANSIKIPVSFEDDTTKDVLIFDETSKYYLGENRLTPKIYASKKDSNFWILEVNYYNLSIICKYDNIKEYEFRTDTKTLSKNIPEAIISLNDK